MTITLKPGFTLDALDITAINANCMIGNPARYDTGTAAEVILDLYKQNNANLIFRGHDVNKGEWRYWTGKHWGQYHILALRNDLTRILGPTTTDKRISDLIKAMELRSCKLWAEFDKHPITTFQNCVLTIQDNEIIKQPFQKKHYCTYQLPIELKRSSTREWQKIITRILPDENDRCTLQELFGYCFFPSLQMQTFFAIQGDAYTGKSTTMAVLRDMLGEERCSSTPLDILNTNHGTSSLLGSWVNFDMESEYLRPEAETMLKAITGGDPVLVNIKHKAMFSTVLPTRMIMSSNNLPRISDKSEGLWSRMVLIPFNVKIPPEERVPIETLLARVRPEYPGILFWALKGLKRILARGTRATAFTRSTHAIDAILEHREFSDPFTLWWKTFIALDQAGSLRKDELYSNYTRWADRSKIKCLSLPHWGRRMITQIQQEYGQDYPATSRPREGEERPWCYNGITLDTDH
jgi:P4 family phage/plasmid primase-like protien